MSCKPKPCSVQDLISSGEDPWERWSSIFESKQIVIRPHGAMQRLYTRDISDRDTISFEYNILYDAIAFTIHLDPAPWAGAEIDSILNYTETDVQINLSTNSRFHQHKEIHTMSKVRIDNIEKVNISQVKSLSFSALEPHLSTFYYQCNLTKNRLSNLEITCDSATTIRQGIRKRRHRRTFRDIDL